MVDTHSQTVAERLDRPEHIIVATDLSDLDVLLPHAIAQAKAYGAQLTFIHAFVTHGIPAEKAGMGREECAAHEQMDELLSRMKAEGISCNGEIVYSSPEEALSQAVRRFRAGRVIMATHGRGRLGQIMLGSVARGLLAFLDIPIFAVGPKAGRKTSYREPKKILHPVSFSHGQKNTVEFALKLAEVHGAELMLMHVHGPDAKEEIGPARILQLAEDARVVFSIPLHAHVAHGNLVEEIANTARVFGADWLILGTNPIAAAPMSYTPVIASNMAYRLMASANVPVLAFPRRVHPGEPTITKEDFTVVAR